MYRLAFVSGQGACVANPAYATYDECDTQLENYVDACAEGCPRYFLQQDVDGRAFAVPCSNEYVIVIEPIIGEETA